MRAIYQSLLLVIAGATQKELARQVKYLKVENEILRGKLPKRITITAKERRRLVRFGQKLGSALRQLTTIVAPGTLLRWIREEKKHGKKKPARRGRRRTPEQIRRLILKLARENEWGYTRILGELKKLGICSVSRNTVKRILKDGGFDPGPKRGEGTWDEFLKQHAASLWQCDFFSKRVLTLKGIREAYVIAFLNVKTRQVVLSTSTFKPDEAWVMAQAESFIEQARGEGLPVRMVQHDRDTKFTKLFDAKLKSGGARPLVGRSASTGSSCSARSTWTICVASTWLITTRSGRIRGWTMRCRGSGRSGDVRRLANLSRWRTCAASSDWAGC